MKILIKASSIGLSSLFLICCCDRSLAFAKQPDVSDLLKQFGADKGNSEISNVNGFLLGPTRVKERKLEIVSGQLIVKLLTPVNTLVQQTGDPVAVEVVKSTGPNGKAWLPVGTKLEGTISQAETAHRGKRDAVVFMSFESASYGGSEFELIAQPATNDGGLHPLSKPMTKKQVVKNLLFTATFVAVPLAIGTGGTSLAITTGAGAVIGGVLAEKGHHISGAFDGAWRGSGLSVLDPLVKKGENVELGVDTTFQLSLTNPIKVPAQIVRLAQNEDKGSIVEMNTSVTMLSAKKLNAVDVESECNRLIAHKDLAAALSLVDRRISEDPNNEDLKKISYTAYGRGSQK